MRREHVRAIEVSERIPILLMVRELGVGGSERQMTEVAKALDRSVFEVHVGCFRPAGMRGEELRDFRIPIAQFPVQSYRSPDGIREALRLSRYIHRNRIAIVHTWDYPLNVFAPVIARTMTRAIAISSQRSDRALIPAAYRRLTALADRMSHAIVVNCRFIEEHLLSRRVPSKKIHVCYNGIDPKQFQRLLRPHPLTIGVVCALRPEKNLITLIDAFALVRKFGPELKLVIVGSGDERPVLEQRAREIGVHDFCHFEPATPRVREWLSMIDIFVLPSMTEALSNSLMEAMACGCCVVASEVGGNPELVQHAVTGLLFRPGDVSSLTEALRCLIADEGRRHQMAKDGQEFISSKFSIARAAERMQQIYSGCLANRSLFASRT